MPPLAVAPNPRLPYKQQPVTAQAVRMGDWLLHTDGHTMFRVKAVLQQPRHSYISFHTYDPVHLRPWDQVILVPPFRPRTHLSPL
jgi:hypothetical protein